MTGKTAFMEAIYYTNFIVAMQQGSKLEDVLHALSQHLSQSPYFPPSETCFPGADIVSPG